MRNLGLLLKIQLLGLFGLNKALHADKNKATRTIALFALAGVGICVLFVIYSAGAASSLVQLGLTDYIPFVAVLVGSMAGAVSAFLKANGVLFAFKDYDIIMSLPVKPLTVVLSRLTALYAMALAFGALAMLPAFVVYLAAVGGSLASIIMVALSVFLAPLLPISLAVLLAVGISAIAARMRHANIVTVVLSIALVLVLVFVPYLAMGSMDFNSTELMAFVSQQFTLLESVLPPITWASNGIVNADVLLYGAFAAVSLASAIIGIALISRWFVSINSMLMASYSRGVFSFDKAKSAAANSPFKALLKKEARRLVSTPVYMMNSCIGFVLIVVAGIGAAIASAIGVLSADMLTGEFGFPLDTLLPWALVFFVGISATTAASVSLEGKSRWLMYTAPVPVRVIYGAKVALNLAIAAPAVVIGGLLLAFAFRVDAIAACLIIVTPLAMCVFTSVLGLTMDARRPRFDWTSEYEPVKRSFSVMITILGGFVVMALGLVLSVIAGHVGTLALAVILVVAAWFLFKGAADQPLQE